MSTNMSEIRVWEQVEKAARSVTNADGHFTGKELREALLPWLSTDEMPAHVRASTLEMQARNLASLWVQRRSPRQHKDGRGRLTLYHPDAVLPLRGSGPDRVWMRCATARDLLTWAQLGTENAARVNAAEAVKQQYVADRLSPMREQSGWLLDRVERDMFGYEPGEDLDWGGDGLEDLD